MSLVAAGSTGTSFPPIEPGTYLARAYGLVDLGRQYSQKYDKSSPKVLIMWELPTETVEVEDRTETRVLSKQYTCSLSDNASLRKDLESWRGRRFTDEELKGFDLRNIVGVPCQLSITNEERNGKTYSNINAVVSIPKGTQVPELTKEKIIFDLDEEGFQEKMSLLPEWIQNRIRESETYMAKIDIPEDTDSDGFTDLQSDDIPF